MIITATVDARDLSCQALANVDDGNPDAPIWWASGNSDPYVVLNFHAEMQRRHDPYRCDLIGCRGGA